MRVLIVAVLAVMIGLLVAQDASAYTAGAAYVWDASTPSYNPAATLHAGTIDLTRVVMGDFLGRNAAQPNALGFGDSGVSVSWDDTWVGGVGNANTNGDALDGLWAQIYSDGGWWDLGGMYNKVAAFSAQDHGPYLGEGLEYRIFGTNTLWDNTSLGAQAMVTDVYLDGWRTHNAAEDGNGNLWLSDDIAGVFQLDGNYRYIKLVAWSSTGGYNEPEMDAVGGVIPEPSTAVLLGLGLAAVAVLRARRRR